MNTESKDLPVPEEAILSKIYQIRGLKVMLDFDLAELYGVETKQLKRAVRRNIERFPSDFMFELTISEYQNLMLQFATSSSQIIKNVKDVSLMSQFATSSVTCIPGIKRTGTKEK